MYVLIYIAAVWSTGGTTGSMMAPRGWPVVDPLAVARHPAKLPDHLQVIVTLVGENGGRGFALGLSDVPASSMTPRRRGKQE